MKSLLFFGVITITCTLVLAGHSDEDSNSSSSSSSSSESSDKTYTVPNKVKLTNAKVLQVSEEYFVNQYYKAEVVKVNKTYNRLAVDYEVKKDFPMDTEFSVQVLRSNSKHADYEKLHEYNIFFCKDFHNEYFKYLSDKLIKIVKEGKCLPKDRDYKDCDAGYFKFYDLLSNKELKDSKFKMITSLKCGKKVLFSFELDFESNDTKY